MEAKHISTDSGEWLRNGPVQIGLLLTGAETNGTLTLIEARDPAGGGIPTHIHTKEDETFFVIEGEVEFVVGGARILAGPGDVLFGPRNVPHSYRAITASRMRVMISPSGMENMFREMNALPPGTTFEETLKVSDAYGIVFPPA